MTPAIERYDLVTIAFWALMLPISAYILHAVANFCTDDAPTNFSRAIFLVLVTAATVFLAFDISGYFFALLMRDPSAGIVLPTGFTYWDWLREPVAVKWNVLGLMPFVRYLPVFFALIVGCIVQIFMWKVDFKLGAVVFIGQVILNLVAMFVLSFVFRFAIEQYERSFPPQPRHEARPEEDLTKPPTGLHELARRARNAKSDVSSFWRKLDVDWEMINGHLEPMYRVLQPVTDHTPKPVHDFLNAGGWPLVMLGTLGLVVFWPRIHRNRKEYLKPRKKRAHARRIKLAEIGDSVSGLGPRQATVNGTPARLRLVVIAGSTPSDKLPELLNAIRPELATATTADYPHVEAWKDFHAREQFRKSVETRVEFPKPAPGWTVLVGRVLWDKSSMPIALGFLMAKPSAVQFVDVADNTWADAIGLRDVPVEERD